MADVTVPVGYTRWNPGSDEKDAVWYKTILIKSKQFDVFVNPSSKQKWIYEKSMFGNGKPLFSLNEANEIVPLKSNETSYDEKASELNNAGLNKNTIISALKSEVIWASPPTQDGLQPAGAPSGAPDDPAGGSEATFDVTSEQFQEDKPFKNTRWLSYPLDLDSRTQDRIVIQQIRYITPDIFNEKAKTVDVSKISSGAFSKERYGKVKSLGTVTLPMPNDISETNVTAWGEDSLSSLAALVGGAGLGVASSLADFNVSTAIDDVKKAAGNALQKDSAANEAIRQLLTLNAAAAVTKMFGININPEAFRSRITGTAINPNLELLFQGPKLRSFAFQFKMSPRSWEEARNIRYIIKFFKKGMAAKRNVIDGKTAYFLGAPNVFNIEFKSGVNTLNSIGKIKTCALQQCVVNYTPDGFYSAYMDNKAGGSQPISVTMQLTFTELTPLYNDNYDDIDTVGYDNLGDVNFNTATPK